MQTDKPSTQGISPPPRLALWQSAAVAGLLLLLAGMLFGSVRQESGLGDEGMHLFAGYEYWKHADFGRNPEHPPFAKLLAALPLLPMHLNEPPHLPIPFFKAQDGANSSEFLYAQNADAMLMRGRLVILLFSLCLGLVVFFAGREMFGTNVGLLALGLLIFEPAILANGALITTDIPLTCLFFATVYAFYRYLRIPSWQRLAVCAFCCAMAIATKHSGILILPTLLLLAVFDLALFRDRPGNTRAGLSALHLAAALAVITLFSYVFLWAIYHFRYVAHPDGAPMAPSFTVYAARLSPLAHGLLTFAARHHLLPEAYLYGWIDILLIPARAQSFLLGKFYLGGTRIFLPVIFLIKTTLTLMVLLLLVPFARIFSRRRQSLFLTLPAIVFALFAIFSKINLGIRHLLPVYPFCFILAASAAVYFVQRYRFAWIGLAALLLLTAISSLHAFPDYLVYANEAFGGPSHIIHLAADANADWGQGLKWTKRYLNDHPTPQCWVAHEAYPIVPPAYYGVPCKPLLNGMANAIGIPVDPLPQTISGTIFVGTSDLSGFLWGPGTLNPYAAFRDGHPDAILNNDVRVFHGTYDISLMAAENNATAAQTMLREGQVAAAVGLAKTAAAQYPESAEVQATLGQVLMAAGQTAEGQKALDQTVRLARTVEPGYQRDLLDQIQHPAGHP
jgi:4-amino-4-deoxy-L-arabinose transferase-like glycosyltransferase